MNKNQKNTKDISSMRNIILPWAYTHYVIVSSSWLSSTTGLLAAAESFWPRLVERWDQSGRRGLWYHMTKINAIFLCFFVPSHKINVLRSGTNWEKETTFVRPKEAISKLKRKKRERKKRERENMI